jgi:hypothetical protein
MKLLLALAPIVIAAMTFAGICGDDSRLTDAEFVEEARRIAEAEPLIPRSEVPEGWNLTTQNESEAPRDPSEEEAAKGAELSDLLDGPEVSNDDCEAFFAAVEQRKEASSSYFFGDLQGAAAQEFTSSTGSSMSAAVSVFRNKEDLEGALDRQDKFDRDCGYLFENKLREAFESEDAIEIGNLEFAFDFESRLDFGDRSSGFTIDFSYSVQGLEGYGPEGYRVEVKSTSAFIQVGRVVLTVDFSDLGDFPGEDQIRIARVVVERAAQIDAALPN